MPPKGAKRAPLDAEQLLCAIIAVKDYPRGREQWQKVADLMPDKPTHEQARGRWRTLKAKWDEESILSPKKEGDQNEGNVASDEDENDGEGQAPTKVKKGKSKAPAKKKETKTKAKTISKQIVIDSEDGTEDEKVSETEGMSTNMHDEDSDVGINVLATKKSIRLAKKASPKPRGKKVEEHIGNRDFEVEEEG
ncbi:uncharacterized protein PAC_09076 [Phialocephala subalpina]|uniref:Myb-like domain-containing protein n=1 Tax=Phialocephala subalpina TaxID=576137 RepID=A0A1L7X2D5_9HELO|nr:uncharacterized protein PAC_09076 [Phialocephala subalpina]